MCDGNSGPHGWFEHFEEWIKCRPLLNRMFEIIIVVGGSAAAIAFALWLRS